MAIVTTHVAAVQELYVAYFGRPADVAGLDYWTNVVAAEGGKLTAVSAAFAKEKEYTDLFAGKTNGQIIDMIYTNMFGHAADAAGRTYWVDLLTAGTVSVDMIVAEVAKGAQGSDDTAVNNKVTGATAFTAALDTPAEQAGYSGAAAAILAKAFVAGITTDATLSAAIAPTSLSATVSAVVVAGTPFTLNGALANLSTAIEARADFLAAADGDDDAETSTTDAELTTAVGTAATAVDGKVAGFAAGSPAVRTALLGDQQVKNAEAVTAAQAKVTAANTAIAEAPGLTSAVATLTAASTSLTNATKAQTTAAADLAAKVATLDVLMTTATRDVVVTVADNGEVTVASTVGGATTTTKVIALNDAGKLALSGTTVTETAFPGVTALLTSTTAKEAADTVVDRATTARDAAKANVDYLDMSSAEITALGNIKAALPEGTVTGTALPTMAQIQTREAALDKAIVDAAPADKAAAQKAHDDFAALVDTYKTAAPTNDRVAQLTTATGEVTTTTKAVTDLTKLVATYNEAVGLQTQSKALNDAVTAAEKVFTDAKVAVPVAADGAVLATGAADIFVAGKTDASISLFGLIGNDSLYIGSGYTLNTTATFNATTGVITGGNNGVLEAFIFNSADGAHVVLENSVFGSSATNPEVVTITLVGVDATEVVLNNGIITA